MKGPGRREKAPFLKADPNPTFILPAGTAKKWEARRGSRDRQSLWVTLEMRAREMELGGVPWLERRESLRLETSNRSTAPRCGKGGWEQRPKV